MSRPYIISALFIAVAVIAFIVMFRRSDQGIENVSHAAIRGHSFSLEIADTFGTRAQGLSDRASLPTDHGMLFVFGAAAIHSFWMKDMHFPIDIVWINGDRIAGVAENALPQPGAGLGQLTLYSPPEPVDKVLEINAGLAQQYGFAVGDTVTFTPPR